MTTRSDPPLPEAPVAACADPRHDLFVRSDLLATISHEIRTGLNGIVGLTALLAETTLTAEQRRYTQMLGTASQSLLAVVDDVLELSQLEAGRAEPCIEDVRLFDLIEDVLQIVAPEACLKGLHLAFVPEPDVPEVVRGDHRALRRILTNLAANGVKFTDVGHVAVHVGYVAAPRPAWRIIVADSGCGIPDAQRPKLFQPFSRVRSPGEPRRPGSGLGLAICAKLIGLLGGDIGVDSSPGSGSRFWFTVPMLAAPAAPGPAMPAPLMAAPLMTGALASGPAMLTQGAEGPQPDPHQDAHDAVRDAARDQGLAEESALLRGQRMLMVSSREALCASLAAFAARWRIPFACMPDVATCATRAGRPPGPIVLIDAADSRGEASEMAAALARLRCRPVLLVPLGWPSSSNPICPEVVLPLRRAALRAALLEACGEASATRAGATP